MADLPRDDYFGVGHKFVIELQPNDFQEKQPWLLRNTKRSGMIFFYAPWCPHCKAVKDEWAKAGQMSGFCDFFAFNCEKHKTHVQSIKQALPSLINGYPTIIYYEDGSPSLDYKGERTGVSFQKYCMERCKSCHK
jgi:thiol-disulfide isomerase/thioredoxin